MSPTPISSQLNDLSDFLRSHSRQLDFHKKLPLGMESRSELSLSDAAKRIMAGKKVVLNEAWTTGYKDWRLTTGTSTTISNADDLAAFMRVEQGQKPVDATETLARKLKPFESTSDDPSNTFGMLTHVHRGLLGQRKPGGTVSAFDAARLITQGHPVALLRINCDSLFDCRSDDDLIHKSQITYLASPSNVDELQEQSYHEEKVKQFETERALGMTDATDFAAWRKEIQQQRDAESGLV